MRARRRCLREPRTLRRHGRQLARQRNRGRVERIGRVLADEDGRLARHTQRRDRRQRGALVTRRGNPGRRRRERPLRRRAGQRRRRGHCGEIMLGLLTDNDRPFLGFEPGDEADLLFGAAEFVPRQPHAVGRAEGVFAFVNVELLGGKNVSSRGLGFVRAGAASSKA